MRSCCNICWWEDEPCSSMASLSKLIICKHMHVYIFILSYMSRHLHLKGTTNCTQQLSFTLMSNATYNFFLGSDWLVTSLQQYKEENIGHGSVFQHQKSKWLNFQSCAWSMFFFISSGMLWCFDLWNVEIIILLILKLKKRLTCQSAGVLATWAPVAGCWHHSGSQGSTSWKKHRFHELLHCSHVESLFVSGVKVCEPLI